MKAALLQAVVHLLLLFSLAGALENGLVRTPPMGWMSWTAFFCEMDCAKHPHACINEQLYMDMANQLVANGYLAAGYRNVHVDDCWMASQRDISGRLLPDPVRFPSGMKALAEYMHKRGLNFGIYEDYGTKTCAGFPGSYGYVETDAQTFADWDADYLKLDGCFIDHSLLAKGYPEMSRALNATGHPIVYSCEWPLYLINTTQKVDYNLVGHYCNLWRNYDDVRSSWDSIIDIISHYDKNQEDYIPYHGPGHWFDPDMLVVGNPGITVDMARAQLTIWSIWSAPLIMSNDLRTIAPAHRDLLLNKEVIAVDQDPLGRMGRLVVNMTEVGVYVKEMSPEANSAESRYAIGVLNRDKTQQQEVSVLLKELGLNFKFGYRMVELWSNEYIGVYKPADHLLTVVNPTGANLFKAVPLKSPQAQHKV